MRRGFFRTEDTCSITAPALQEEDKILKKKLEKRTCKQPPRHDRTGLASLQEEDKTLKKKNLKKRLADSFPVVTDQA